ncbi:unnamed protein product [Symbiodinium sp. CCMP2592]|nr:unnamed protein product [Symbiodinium sp. CCMP2592]
MSRCLEGLFLKAQLHSSYIFAMNYKPFGSGAFYQQKKDMLESFVSCTSPRRSSLWDAFREKIAYDLGRELSGDEHEIEHMLADVGLVKSSRWFSWNQLCCEQLHRSGLLSLPSPLLQKILCLLARSRAKVKHCSLRRVCGIRWFWGGRWPLSEERRLCLLRLRFEARAGSGAPTCWPLLHRAPMRGVTRQFPHWCVPVDLWFRRPARFAWHGFKFRYSAVCRAGRKPRQDPTVGCASSLTPIYGECADAVARARLDPLGSVFGHPATLHSRYCALADPLRKSRNVLLDVEGIDLEQGDRPFRAHKSRAGLVLCIVSLELLGSQIVVLFPRSWQYGLKIRRYDHYCKWVNNVIG